MLKAPQRSKRRIAAELGDDAAAEAARRLTACALEDLAAWPGRAWAAPADDDSRAWLSGSAEDLPVIPQGDGNLGERIERVNHTLNARGVDRQMFIGIDCPELDLGYFEQAAGLLDDHDVVLGPAHDGGVVLMGVRGLFPPLGTLPWSTAALGGALADACRTAGRAVGTLEPRADMDTVHDLAGLRARLRRDGRAARRALCRWLADIGLESD